MSRLLFECEGFCPEVGLLLDLGFISANVVSEIKRDVPCLISMDPDTQSTTLAAPPPSETQDAATIRAQTRSRAVEEKTFTFDNSFWSHDKEDPHYATQEDVYNSLGEEFLDHNFEGYHTCIFAYGQTGSGKSYTMMGTPDNPGLIPRTCEDLFQRIDSSEAPNITYNVRVSYFEVYNEHVRDLLVPRTDTPYYLKIRESPSDGPYVKDLTDVPVRNFAEIMKYMQKGDASRTTASTKMNDTSSRSHSVFTIMLKQIHHDLSSDETTERVARIRLVDLAGSERAKSTETTGQRLREGSNINKSLTTLGRVIASLADNKPRGGRKREIVPYRDSILTWLLKDSLGGNSKTAMIACISPSDYEETLSTLRYADQAKRIRTRAIVNQDHMSAAERDAQIAEMAETIRSLQLSVSQQTASKREHEKQGEKLEEYQDQVTKLQQIMEENKMVSQSKIRQLSDENEALRRHLRLALDSLKNLAPMEASKQRRRSSNLEAVPEARGIDNEEDKENRGFDGRDSRRQSAPLEKPAPQEKHILPPIRAPTVTSVPDSLPTPDSVPASAEEEPTIWQDDDFSSLGFDATNEADVLEVQSQMQELLSDLNFFRRKVADDHERFGIKSSAPLSDKKDKRALSEIWVNI